MKKVLTFLLVLSTVFASEKIQAQAPTVNSSSVVTVGVTTSSISINWNSGNGSKRIVTCALSTSPVALPVTGGNYTQNSTFGSGTNLGSGNYCIYNGTSYGCNAFGLTPNTSYRFRIYEYNTIFTTEYYLTSGYPIYTDITLQTEPVTSASALAFSNVTVSGANLAFTSGSGTYDLLAIRSAASYSNVPVDATDYAASSTYGSGGYISGAIPYSYVLSDNTSTSINATSLAAGTTYTAAVFPYNGTGGAQNYKTTSYPTTTFTTLATQPTSYSYPIAFSNMTSTSMTVSWTPPTSGGGTYRIVTCKPGAINSDLPVDATYYTPGSVYGTGTQIGGASGAYCVYNGTGNFVNVTGLSSGTTYCFSVFEYNVANNLYNNTYNYYTAGYLTGSQATPAAEPTVSATSLAFSSITSNSFRATWVNGNGNRRVVGVAAGRKQTALALDGTNDYVTIPYNSALQPTSVLTVECWAYRSNWASSVSGSQTLVGNTENGGYSIDLSGTTVTGYLYRNSSYALPSTNISTLISGWHHFALTYDGQRTRLYVDGAERASNSAGGYYSIQYSYSNSIIIGAEVGTSTTATGEYFNGKIDEVRVWNVYSSAATIVSNMNKTLVGNESGLKGYWKLNEGFASSSVIANSSFTTLTNGTLVNFASTAAATNFTATSGWVNSGAKVNVPLDYVYYADNSAFMSTGGSSYYYGNLYFTVYKGPDSTTINVTNLSPGTYYNVGVFDYNGVSGDNNYLTESYAVGEVQTNPGTAPTITSFTPAFGYVGSVVTINGTGFNSTLANNIVYFGAAKATVLSVTGGGTIMTVKVPAGSTYERISVTNNTLTAYSTKAFNVTSPCGSTVFSAGTFSAGVNATSYYPYEMRIADMDQDGLSDIVGMYYTYISVTRNTSASGIANLSSIYYFNNPSIYGGDLDVADFDGDGKTDVIFSNTSGSDASFIVTRNTSTVASITMAPSTAFAGATGYVVSDIVVADFDKDGKPDVIQSYNNNILSFFRNTSSLGSISFAPRTDVAVSGTSVINAITTGDIDGDGKIDVAIAGGSSSMIHYLRNTSVPGSITFATFTTTTLSGTITGITIGDIDTDGKPEILYGASSSTVGILKNNSTSGTITISASPVVLTTLANTPRDIKLGDIDGDGKADVTVGYSSGSQVSIFKNVSTASISVNTKFDFNLSAGAGSYSLGLCDMNNDSKTDLLSTTNSSSCTYFQNNINPLAAEPTVQTSGLTFAGVTTTQITCNFTPGNGANKVVFVRAATSPVSGPPTDGVGYVPNTTFGSGTDLGGGNYCVMDGNASGVTVSGLQSNTSYVFSVYEYNGVLNCQYNYLTTSTSNTATQATNNNPPTLTAISDPTSICQSSGLQTINMSGITTGSGSEVQTLTITATSSNTGLIPHPTVTYTSPNPTGTLTYTPVAGIAGTAIITVTVNDGASNNNTIVRTFTVTVDNTPTASNAGPNQVVCPSVASLAGNTPAFGTGLWTMIATTNPGITITSPTNPTSTVTGFAIGDSATFRWTISNGACASSGNNSRVKRINCPTTADFTTSSTAECLSGSPVITYTDASVASGATIISWNWNFGAGAFPPTATGVGPHTVSYSTSGAKTVSLQVTDNLAASDIEIKVGFVNINDVPNPSGNVSGSATVCQGQSGVAYSVPVILGATGYTWSLPSGATLISGVNTNSITVDYGAGAISGNITATGTNSCGSGLSSANFPVTINPLPSASGVITGLTSVCDGATGVTYSVSSIANATSYNWTVPGGVTIMSGATTNSITVDFAPGSAGGTISVFGVNSCGNGVSASTNIIVNPYPAAADLITGLTAITNCPSTAGVTYSIPLVDDATSYNWTLPSGATIVSGAGTNSITVDYSAGATSGSVTVTPVNSCGNGVSSTLMITVNTLPDLAGSITGSDTLSVCPASDSIIYSIPSIFNADYYVWSVPAGATIVSGDSTNSITVNYSNTAVSGSITVYGENACGVGSTSTFEIFVTSVPQQELCMVSVDPTSTFNVVTWEKPIASDIDSFRVYREVLSSFVHVGSVPYDSLSEYNDSTYLPVADPNTTNFRYKISIIDTCGNESVLSNHHRTIFLQANQGVGGVVNLNWVPYEGATVDFYRILRDTLGTGVYVAIDSVPGSNTIYTDNAPPVSMAFVDYLLESNWSTVCTPTRASINTTRSNIRRTGLISSGIADQEILNGTINVYPNPAIDMITIEYPAGFKKYQLQLFDALGQLVVNEQLDNDPSNNGVLTHTVNVGEFTKGVYFVHLQTENSSAFKRVVIQ